VPTAGAVVVTPYLLMAFKERDLAMFFETLEKTPGLGTKVTNWAGRSGLKQCSSMKEGKTKNQGGELSFFFSHP